MVGWTGKIERWLDGYKKCMDRKKIDGWLERRITHMKIKQMDGWMKRKKSI